MPTIEGFILDDKRRAKKIISDERLDQIELLIQDNSYEGHDQKLDSLRHKCKLHNCSDRTIVRTLKEREIGFYIDQVLRKVVKPWLDEGKDFQWRHTKEECVNAAEKAYKDVL